MVVEKYRVAINTIVDILFSSSIFQICLHYAPLIMRNFIFFKDIKLKLML